MAAEKEFPEKYISLLRNDMNQKKCFFCPFQVWADSFEQPCIRFQDKFVHDKYEKSVKLNIVHYNHEAAHSTDLTIYNVSKFV